MSTINTFQLESIISNELRDHGYFPWVMMRKKESQVSEQEIYYSLLNPATSPYLNTNGFRTVLQSNASLVNIMFYAIYCGYLYASIKDDSRYDNILWTYSYMHQKLNGHIYEPIIISLLPQIFDYTLPEELKNLYNRDSRTIFNLIYRWIYSFVKTYELSNDNLYENTNKTTEFYKSDLPKALCSLHHWGTSLFYAIRYDKENRIYGKSIISTNLLEDLNELE